MQLPELSEDQRRVYIDAQALMRTMADAQKSLAQTRGSMFWRELRGVGWWRLAGWAAAAGCTVSLAGLVVLGRDGEMLTYAAMVSAIALALLWAGWRRRG